MYVVDRCDYCGSAFGGRTCYFCDRSCCTSCMTDDRTRCMDCHMAGRRLGLEKMLGKNKLLLAFIGALCIYAVFAGQFIPDLDPGFYTVTVIAATLVMMPICLILFFWSISPPTSGAQRR